LVSGTIAQVTVTTSLYGLSVADYYRTIGPLYERRDAEFELARSIVGEDEGILQVPFDLYRYVWIGRKPASGVFFWMPWMHDYSTRPILGHELNLCEQIEKNAPKLLYFNDFPIWHRPTDRWMLCMKELVAKRYVRVGELGDKAMLRADILADHPKLLATAIVTNELDFSKLNQRQAQVLRGALIEFAEFRKDGRCIAESGTPGGDGQIVSEPCDVDPEVKIVRRDSETSSVLDEKTGRCLEHAGTRGIFAKCRDLASEQGFLVEQAPGGPMKIQDVTNLSRCVGPPAMDLVITHCTPDGMWRDPSRQEFAIRHRADGTAELVSKSTGWCVEVTGASRDEGGGLRAWPCIGSPNQLFHVDTDETGKIGLRNAFSDRCLTIRDMAVLQGACDGTARLDLVVNK